MDLARTLVTLVERTSPNLGQWLLIIIGGSVLAGVLFIIALIAIIGSRRFSAGGQVPLDPRGASLADRRTARLPHRRAEHDVHQARGGRR
jgi:hypothetical protein